MNVRALTKRFVMDKFTLGLLIASVLLVLASVFYSQFSNGLALLAAPVQVGDPDRTFDGNYLHNGDLRQGSHAPSDDPSDAGNATGRLANGWFDNSDSTIKGLRYSLDSSVTHDGHPSQRIDLPSKSWGGTNMSQNRVLPIGFYKGIVWLQARGHVPVAVSLTDGGLQLSSKIMATPVWRRVELSGWVLSWQSAAYSISVRRGGTIWMADASLRRTSDGYFIAAALCAAFALAILGASQYIRNRIESAELGSITVRIGGDSPDGAPGEQSRKRRKQ